MHTIKLELSDELIKTLAPYRDILPDLLELGLREWLKRERRRSQASQERALQVLVASGRVEAPHPYTGEQPYVRHTPVPITGKPVSQLVIEQRGTL